MLQVAQHDGECGFQVWVGGDLEREAAVGNSGLRSSQSSGAAEDLCEITNHATWKHCRGLTGAGRCSPIHANSQKGLHRILAPPLNH